MAIRVVDLKAQYVTIADEVDEALHNVVDNAYFILGKDVELFEQEFASFCEADHAIGVDSGTSALERALATLLRKPGHA